MTPCRVRTLWFVDAVLVLSAVTACDSTQLRARQHATERWNEARAQVKARLAADQFATGNVAGAAAELAEALRLDPANPEWVPLRARLLLAEGRLDAAAELLERARGAAPASAEVEYLLGIARQQQERWDEALAAYQRAVELDETEVAYLVALAQTWLQLGEPQRALETLAERAPRFGWTNAYRAAVAECYEQSGDWTAAADAWAPVASDPKAAVDLRERWAVALYRAGRYDEAIPALKAVLDAAAESVVLRLALAECYLARGQTAAAREQAQWVLRREPSCARAWRVLARGHAREGDYAAALRAVHRALAIEAQDVCTLELAAALAWRTGDQQSALSAAQRLLACDAANPVARRLVRQLGPGVSGRGGE